MDRQAYEAGADRERQAEAASQTEAEADMKTQAGRQTGRPTDGQAGRQARSTLMATPEDIPKIPNPKSKIQN